MKSFLLKTFSKKYKNY